MCFWSVSGQAEVSSVGLLGSTGSYVYLSRAERRRAIETAVNVLKGDVPLIVGAGALRTDDACELAKDAAKAGADALLLAPVSYLPLTEEEVFQHFVSVASVTDLPLVIYNNPGTTHFSFSTDLLKRLAAVSDIAAVKMPLPAGKSVSDELAFLRAELPENFAIGYSGDWGCGEALLAGSDTFYSGFAGLFPEMATRLAMSAGAGDVSETHRLDAELEPIWSLFRAHGSLRVIYAAAKHLGLTTCDAPRPVLPLGKDITRKVAETIEKLSG